MANYLDRIELLNEAKLAHDKFCKWRNENNIIPGQQYVKRIMRGAIPPPPPITDAFYIMLWRMGKGLMSGPSFANYSEDWKDEMLVMLAEALIHFHGKFNYKDKKFKDQTEDEMAKGCFAFFTKCIKRAFYAALVKLKVKADAEKKMIEKADHDYYHNYDYPSVEDEMILREELQEAGLDEYGDKEGAVVVKEIKGIRKFRGKYCPECGGEVIGCSTRKKYCDECAIIVQRRQCLEKQRAKRFQENVPRNCIICGKILPLHKKKLCGDAECKRKQVNNVATTYIKMRKTRIKNGMCMICGIAIDGTMGRLYCDTCKRKVRNRKTTIRRREKKQK